MSWVFHPDATCHGQFVIALQEGFRDGPLKEGDGTARIIGSSGTSGDPTPYLCSLCKATNEKDSLGMELLFWKTPLLRRSLCCVCFKIHVQIWQLHTREPVSNLWAFKAGGIKWGLCHGFEMGGVTCPWLVLPWRRRKGRGETIVHRCGSCLSQW